jgi:hypothetical protein
MEGNIISLILAGIVFGMANLLKFYVEKRRKNG